MYEMHVVVRVGVIEESFRKLLKEGWVKAELAVMGKRDSKESVTTPD